MNLLWPTAALLAVSPLLRGDAPEIKASLPEPPPMATREMARSNEPLPGERIELRDGDTGFTLFIPETWKAGADGATLTLHFHGAPGFAIEEHLRRGLHGPVAVANLGSGSSAYRGPFEDRQRFKRWLQLVETELNRGETSRPARITTVDISSFSAGYGAVRELVKSPEHIGLIRRIVLSDSMYAGLAANSRERREAASEHIEPWLAFARAAQRGEKTFVLTYSQVPTETYASTAECAAAIIEALNLDQTAVAPGSNPARSDAEFPLLRRVDSGNLHLWGYDGKDARAHTAHLRHLADVWKALDAAGKP